MGDDEIRKAEKSIPTYLSEGLLAKDSGYSRFVPFFQDNAKMSFQLANFLFKLSTDNEVKKQNGFPKDYECLIWVVVIAYYGMFYTASAALAKLGLKVSDKIPHKVTQDALTVYFLQNKRIAKSLLEDYKATKAEVLNLMNVNEEDLLKDFQIKAQELVATFDFQRKRRGEFQYEIKTGAKQQVAQTSLDRAKKFIQEMTKVIQKIK